MTSFTREELYNVVWGEPVRTAASRLGISDVALAKACRKNDIPIPPRGHWAKVEAGKKTYKQPLSRRGIGMPQTITVGEQTSYGYREPKDLIAMDLPLPPTFDETVEDLTARVQTLVGKVAVPKDFTRAHRIVGKLLADDEARRQKQLASRWPSLLDGPLFDSPFERRRLRFVSALLIGLERSGARPSGHVGKDPSTFEVRIGDQAVSLGVDAPKTQRGGWRPPREASKPAPDKLAVTISSYEAISGVQLAWEDKGKDRVESHAAAIVACVIVAAELKYRGSVLRSHEWLVSRKAQLIEEARKRKEEEERKERERKIRLEKARVDRLLGEAEAFRQAADIRAYVQSVRAANTVAAEPVSDDELDAWTAWAIAQADRIDPVSSRRFLEKEQET